MALITKDLNTPALTAQQLAEFIIGDTGTVVAGTAKFTGDNRASGTFGGGISEGINVEAGVIFSTGEIKNANGPNNSDGKSSSLASAGDPVTLDPLVAPDTTKNAAVLEFEFIAKQSQFSLEYVFASEEYNEYVGSFNDVFAFVLNGVNIPLIPGTNQPVSINTINKNKNSAFYIDNDPTTYGLGKTPYNTQFDGFTKLLTAQGTVIPNITNKLRIAIADTRDSALDSAIFLNVPPSFNFSQPTYQVKEDGKVIGAAVTINRTGITNGTSNIDVKLTNGSATGGATLGLGVDFVFTTQTVNFAPNQTTAEVIIPINDDSLVEPTENLTLTLTNPANARIGITQNTATLNITDNDTTGITITSSGGNTAVTESGTTDTYTAVLNSQPASLVILTVKPDNQTDLGTGAGNPIALNFTPLNWNVPQTVTVKAADDAVAEASPHTSTILHTASSADPNYDGSTPPIRIDGTAISTLTANITDNDTAQVKITETGGTTKLGEGGASDNYTAVLTSQPTADVTVTAFPDSQSDVGTGGGNPIALKFTADNWNVPQLVTVQAVDDAVDQGTHSSTIAHKVTSTDAKYNLIPTASVTAQITDNDTAGVTISPANTTATEGGAAGSYKVALTSKPTAPVKVNFNTGIQIQSISTFTFTSDNWNLPQTVTVKATDDSLVEELHTGTINHSIAAGSAAEYLPVAIAPVTVSITDNDIANPSTPSVTIAPASTNATEGGATGSYKVSLNTKPTANVTVNVAAGSQINAIAPLVFTPVNWNAPQTVTVTATDDTVVEGTHTGTINHSVATGSAAEYLPVAIAPVTVSITDNDTATSTAGVKISPTSTTAAEGGVNGSYSAVLTSKPASDVKVSFATDSEIEAIASFTFSSANWNLPQTATVKAVDDSAVEGTQLSTITASASSTDLAYNKIGIPKVDVLVIDNDSPGIAVTPNSTNAAEGGAAGSYSIVLTKAPTANVTVNFATGGEINAIAPIVFTALNWNVPQTVTVTATDDTVVEGTHTGTIDHSVATGSAAEYLPVAIAPVSVSITDNDTATTAGVTVTQTGGSTIVAEGGTADTYQVALNSQPKNDVKVSFATDSQIDAIASFTFTSANWNLPQTATVKAVDDSAVEGTHLSTITFSASSTDLAYNKIGISKVDVLILDNDSPGIAVIPTSTNAAEGGATGSYSVVLTKAPTANVTVNFAAGSQIDAIAPLVFTPANWNAAQNVTVKATDDTIVEGTHTGLIFSSVAPDSAAEYLPVAIAPVSVTIADNDIAPPTPTPIINFSPTIIVPTPTPPPTPTPIINFSPTIIVPTPTPPPTPTPTPTPLSETTPVLTPQPTEDPDCICAQITLPEISRLQGFNRVDNNLVGGDTNETVTGGSGGDGINGLPGEDVLVGLAGNDNLFGGLISNIPVGPSADRDLLDGGPGDDYLNGQAGYDTLLGGEGNDAGFGGKDNDAIWGGLGADTLEGEEGNDTLYGGTNTESDRDRAGNDLLFGGTGNDLLYGQDASDSLSGGEGSDTARGGKGNDVILGDGGSDSLLGDQGNDSICGGEGDDTVYGDIGSALPVGVVGGQDQVCGGEGNDLLFGNEGSDTINGDAGNDTILGGKDSDSLVGGEGDDLLIGDEGSDTLLGGGGRDLFFLTSGQGSDTVYDFRKGEDLLSLAGGLTFAQLSISHSTNGQDASPTTFIRIANSGELLAVLNGVQASAIAPSDFVQILRLGS
ncbi:choice-of-anchor L domain-containing protein [Microcoleus sp.]|uniref:choice-of-anchor L domain-containing protein n=1 Tax=Microcoleus sp. TaxID=44472 RepID=UPI00352482AA